MIPKNYFPLIKTRDAELRCFKNLRTDQLSKITPIYELTKSRNCKSAPDGDIHKRMRQITEIQQDNSFILDLTTDKKYLNPQILQLLNNENGFDDWFQFLSFYKKFNIIPMVHIHQDEEDSFDDVKQFVKKASSTWKTLAVRLPHDLNSDTSFYLNPIFDALENVSAQ